MEEDLYSKSKIKGNSFEEILTLINTYITKSEDIEFVTRAFEYAKKKHEGQFRKSGEPYINHCIAVTYILAYYQLSPVTLAAGFLHDTVEDCGVTYEELKTTFNEDVADIVNAVTKIKRLPDVSLEETNAATHRKLILAMAKDIRGVIVKLCDRLHNMRTLGFQREEKQKRIANETLEVYAPLANRLGMSELKNELENLCLYYLKPEEYQNVSDLISKRNEKSFGDIDKFMNNIHVLLNENNIPHRIFGRNKHIFSVYKKMYEKHTPFEQIYDLQAIRIVTKTKLQCYEILGIIHTIYRPVPLRFKDYIAMPKQNMYQSLHTTIFDAAGNLFEVQIRTEEMDYVAERGIAAHWIYKENYGDNSAKNQKMSEEQLTWLKELVKLNEVSSDESDTEYMKQVSQDILESNIYVLSPKGKIIDLPVGSTPVDFAFRIHSAVGNNCIGAKVNQIIVPLDSELHSGDIVEIRTSKTNMGPREDWLKFVKTAAAKSAIKKAIQKRQSEENKVQETVDDKFFAKGKDLFKIACDERQIQVNDAIKAIEQQAIFNQLNVSGLKELVINIGKKSISASSILERVFDQNLNVDDVVEKINEKNTTVVKKTVHKDSILVNGASGIKIEPAVCCKPIPGDQIVGFITRGSGIKCHRLNCKNISKESRRLINATWAENSNETMLYPVDLEILSYDRGNLVVDLMSLISSLKIRTDSLGAKSHYENKTATINVTIQVANVDALNVLIARIRQLTGIIEVKRKMK